MTSRFELIEVDLICIAIIYEGLPSKVALPIQSNLKGTWLKELTSYGRYHLSRKLGHLESEWRALLKQSSHFRECGLR